MGAKKERHRAKISEKEKSVNVAKGVVKRKLLIIAVVMLLLFLVPIAISIAASYLENNSLSPDSYQTQRLQQPNLMKFNASVQVINEPVTQQAATTTTDAITYYHNDHKGQPEYMTDESGNIVWRREQEPFGEETLQRTTPLPYRVMAFNETHRMPGQEFDPEIALNINGARYYNPKTGRYTTPDPIGQAGDINPYAYAENNPVTKFDPTGLKTYTGDASYYNLVGFKTASGEMFDSNIMAGAMTSEKVSHLPTNVQVKYNNKGCEKKIDVKINDRGPFAVGPDGRAVKPLTPHPTRIIDLTPAAFNKLSDKEQGILHNVKVEVP